MIGAMRNSKENNDSGQKPAKEGHLFGRWKNPSKNKMGNDISSEVKIANAGDAREGRSDRRWHMNKG